MRRASRAALLMLLFALPAALVPGMVWEARLGWASAGLAIAIGIVAFSRRAPISAPPPVYDLCYLVLLPVWVVALVGINAWAAGRAAPGALGGAAGLLDFRFGPLWTSTLPPALENAHGACLVLTLVLTLAVCLRLAIMRFPREGERDWALAFREGRAVEVSKIRAQKIWGTGALRNIAIGFGALYFPLRESYTQQAMELGTAIPIELALFLLIAVKCAVVSSLIIVGVAILKIGLAERERIAGAITGREADR